MGGLGLKLLFLNHDVITEKIKSYWHIWYVIFRKKRNISLYHGEWDFWETISGKEKSYLCWYNSVNNPGTKKKIADVPSSLIKYSRCYLYDKWCGKLCSPLKNLKH
jgi:hypothetical protein